MDRSSCNNASDEVSEVKELDLFITGTNVNGKIYTQFDDAGHPVDIKDHRSVFLLKHRKGRKEPFRCAPNSDVGQRSLAKLARITSTFPVAFAPVSVCFPGTPDVDADSLLSLWGKLEDTPAFFLDGGILDNKPFTHALNAVFYRVADREVDRKLFRKWARGKRQHLRKRQLRKRAFLAPSVRSILTHRPGSSHQ